MSDPALTALGDVRLLHGDGGAPPTTRPQDGGLEPGDHFKIRYLREPGPGCAGVPLSSGFSSMEPSEFEFTFEQDETLLVLEGEAEVVVDGGTRLRLAAGDGVFWPKGTHTRWSVKAPWREFFTLVG